MFHRVLVFFRPLMYPYVPNTRDVKILICWNYGSLSMHYKNLAISRGTWRIPLNILAITTIDCINVLKELLKWDPRSFLSIVPADSSNHDNLPYKCT